MSPLAKTTLLLGSLGLAVPSTHAAGELDTTFSTISITGGLNTAVPQADGKILLGGAFSLVQGGTRAHGARLLANGGLDTYNPTFNNQVNSIRVDASGNTVFCGKFTAVNVNKLASFIAKFNEAGVVNATFQSPFSPHQGYYANSISPQGDSYIVATDLGLHRISSIDGDLDTLSFKAYPYGRVLNTLFQGPDKIYLGGTFTAYSPLPTPPPNPPVKPPVNNWYFDRVGYSGGHDATFDNPAVDGAVRAFALQANGQILLAGDFNQVTTTLGTTTTVRNQKALARLHSTGAHDTVFAPGLSNFPSAVEPYINCIALQADGKILVGGFFSTISSTVAGTTTSLTRRGIARFNSNGTVDATFDAKINTTNYEVTSISILGDGKLLVTCGDLVGFNSVQKSDLVRLNNDAAVSIVRAADDKTVRWMRGGTAPEVSSVDFEYSYDGSFWIPLGAGYRISGGWETTFPTSLPPTCSLRATGVTTGGIYNSSSGIVSATGIYPVPVIAVAPTGKSNVANGGTTTVAPVAAGTSRDYSFDLRNPGTGQLASVMLNITGPDAYAFTLGSSPTLPVGGPAGAAPFTINFAPLDMGTKTATLNVTSFDTNVESTTYSITLTGNGVTEIEDWRFQYFGITTDTGNAAANADPDGDGHTNQFEFIAGLIPNSRTSRFEQRVDATSGNARIIFSPVVAGRTYEVLTNLDLGTTWTPAVVGPPSDTGAERTLTETGIPDPKRFYRVRITKP